MEPEDTPGEGPLPAGVEPGATATGVTRVVYLCHPVSGDVAGNLERTRRWVRWVYDNVPGVVVLCMWVVDCEVLDDANPEHRALGFEHDLAVVERCDEIWAVSGRISHGMSLEIAHAREHGVPLLDLTPLGEEPPAKPINLPPLVWREERT